MFYNTVINNKEYFFDGDRFDLYIDTIKDIEININDNERTYYPKDTLHRVEFLITTKCMGECKYCYQKGEFFGNISPYMTEDTVNKIIESLKRKYRIINEVLFFWGGRTYIIIKFIKL